MSAFAAIPYYVGAGGIFLIAAHRWRTARAAAAAARPPAPPPLDGFPRVTLQIPVFNEKHVVARVLGSLHALDYPRGRFEVQVLDDSTDETSAIAASAIAELAARGLDVRHRRRARREGFKAGALAAGLEAARGEFVAIFDADFVVPPDFLRRALPHFADPAVGCVQARWDFLNPEENLLTRVQSVLLHAHFQVEQAARGARGLFVSFNGTAGIWRAAALRDAGGWTDRSLTEDLDVSYRAQLRGWKIRYLPDLAAFGLLPTTFLDFKRQQCRWATGSAQSLKNLWRPLVRAPLPWRVKGEALLHLARHGAYALTFLALAAMPWVVARRERGDPRNLCDAAIFLSATVMIVRYFLAADANRRRRAPIRAAACAAWVGLALTPSAVLAMARGLWPAAVEFVRTPKGSSYRQRLAWTDAWDACVVAYFWLCVGKFFLSEFWVSKPLLLATGAGLSLPFARSVFAARTKSGTP